MIYDYSGLSGSGEQEKDGFSQMQLKPKLTIQLF
jgi:hypothetical protein